MSRWTRAVERWLNGGTCSDKEWKSSTVVFTPLDWSSTPFSRWQMWMAAAQGGGSPTLAGGDGGRGRAKSCRHSFGPNPHRSSISREDTPVLNNSRACLPPSPPTTRRKRGRGRDAFEDETRDYLTLGGPEVLLLLGWEGPALGVGVGGAR